MVPTHSFHLEFDFLFCCLIICTVLIVEVIIMELIFLKGEKFENLEEHKEKILNTYNPTT